MPVNTGPDINTYEIPEVSLSNTFNAWRDVSNLSSYKLNKLKVYSGLSTSNIGLSTTVEGIISATLTPDIPTGHTFSGGIRGTTASFTNSLTVVGGFSLAGGATISGDLAVQGGDITTSSATASLFNTTATTLNIGSAATTVNVGIEGGGSVTNIKSATVNFSGNLVVGGTATSFNTTNLFVEDTVITLGVCGGIGLTGEVTKDRGVEFHWYASGPTADLGFFGFDRSTQNFIFYSNGVTSPNGIYSGVTGTFQGNYLGGHATFDNLSVTGATVSDKLNVVGAALFSSTSNHVGLARFGGGATFAGGGVTLETSSPLNVQGLAKFGGGATFGGGGVTLESTAPLNVLGASNHTGLARFGGGATFAGGGVTLETSSPLNVLGASNHTGLGTFLGGITSSSVATTTLNVFGAAKFGGGSTFAGGGVTLETSSPLNVQGLAKFGGGATFAGGGVTLESNAPLNVQGLAKFGGGVTFGGGGVILESNAPLSVQSLATVNRMIVGSGSTGGIVMNVKGKTKYTPGNTFATPGSAYVNNFRDYRDLLFIQLDSGDTYGMIVLELPGDPNYAFVNLYLSGYNYAAGLHWDSVISAYARLGSPEHWHFADTHMNVKSNGKVPFNTVRLGQKAAASGTGSRLIILGMTGDQSTLWSYGDISIDRLRLSFASADHTAWEKGITASFVYYADTTPLGLSGELYTVPWEGINGYSGGNYGLGTVTPTALLDVDGTLKSASLTTIGITATKLNVQGLAKFGGGATFGGGGVTLESTAPLSVLGASNHVGLAKFSGGATFAGGGVTLESTAPLSVLGASNHIGLARFGGGATFAGGGVTLESTSPLSVLGVSNHIGLARFGGGATFAGGGVTLESTSPLNVLGLGTFVGGITASGITATNLNVSNTTTLKDLFVSGNLTFGGTAATINVQSTNVNVADTIIVLGSSGGVGITGDVTNDRGVAFFWNEQANSPGSCLGFFGFDRATENFVFYTRGASTGVGSVGGVTGTFEGNFLGGGVTATSLAVVEKQINALFGICASNSSVFGNTLDFKAGVAGNPTNIQFSAAVAGHTTIKNVQGQGILFLGANNQDQLSISTQYGGIGIGTAAPGASLDVQGSVKAKVVSLNGFVGASLGTLNIRNMVQSSTSAGITSNPQNNAIVIESDFGTISGAGNTYCAGILWKAVGGSVANNRVLIFPSTNFSQGSSLNIATSSTYANGIDTIDMTIVNNRVGINNVAPAVALDVVGEARSSVSTTSGSDSKTLTTKDYIDTFSLSSIHAAEATNPTVGSLKVVSLGGTSITPLSNNAPPGSGTWLWIRSISGAPTGTPSDMQGAAINAGISVYGNTSTYPPVHTVYTQSTVATTVFSNDNIIWLRIS